MFKILIMEYHSFMVITLFSLILRCIQSKVSQHIYSGSYTVGGEGTITAPDTYPEKNYPRHGDLYIFIIENTELEGAIQLTIDEFYLHPESWILIRDSKYGGYMGKVIGRFEDDKPPPIMITSKSCCLRIEFTVGCCGPAFPGSTGFKLTYKYVYTPRKGRQDNCTAEKVFTQLCNGECIPPLDFTCPVKILDPKDIESKYGKFYPVAIILATIATFLIISIIVLCMVFWFEKHAKWKRKNCEDENELLNALANKIEVKQPIVLLQVGSEEARQCEQFIDHGLYYSREDSYSSES